MRGLSLSLPIITNYLHALFVLFESRREESQFTGWGVEGEDGAGLIRREADKAAVCHFLHIVQNRGRVLASKQPTPRPEVSKKGAEQTTSPSTTG